VLRAYDKAHGKAESFEDALRRLKAAEPFAPDNANERENVEKLYKLLGADDTATLSLLYEKRRMENSIIRYHMR
jgi:hypothetical protein